MANDSDDDKGKVINELIKLANEELVATRGEIKGVESSEKEDKLIDEIIELDEEITDLQQVISK
ncbi:MAG: hypothetical protein ACI94Y_003308 [Maribacter sp.]|jgi:hypothetical protein